jgi:hypothetical protein
LHDVALVLASADVYVCPQVKNFNVDNRLKLRERTSVVSGCGRENKFVSANIHTSLDGARVANYAQWRSVEDFQGMLGNAHAQVHMREATAVAKSSPVLYRVHSVHR